MPKKEPEIIIHQEHECFSLVTIDGEMYFLDIQLRKIERVVLPAGNSPSLVEYRKPVSVSPRSGIRSVDTNVDRKD